jgi:hypothetical protein
MMSPGAEHGSHVDEFLQRAEHCQELARETADVVKREFFLDLSRFIRTPRLLHHIRSEVSICARKRGTGSDRLGVVRLRIRRR